MTLREWLDGQEFHELCMDYRATVDGKSEFESLQRAIAHAVESDDRKMYAAAALTGITSDSTILEAMEKTAKDFGIAIAVFAAQTAFEYADAMIAQGAKA